MLTRTFKHCLEPSTGKQNKQKKTNNKQPASRLSTVFISHWQIASAVSSLPSVTKPQHSPETNVTLGAHIQHFSFFALHFLMSVIGHYEPLLSPPNSLYTGVLFNFNC